MQDIKQVVRKKYASIASSETPSCCSSGTAEANCCAPARSRTEASLAEADLGLGCGMPTRYAAIQPGEVVLDLGSGAGIDVFRAAALVGPTGRVIGVDMTPEMIARAWQNAVDGSYQNVDFRLGDIESLPVASESVDVVLSNCVINLAPDKRRVYEEILRVLRPPDAGNGGHGGRFAISDVVSYGPIPPSIRQDAELWTGCIAGALDGEEYLQLIRDAGFSQLEVKDLVKYNYLKGEDYGLASMTLVGRRA